MLTDVLVWAVFGLIAGWVAQFLMPGRDPGESFDLKGFLFTALLGIAGAVVGGYIGHALGLTPAAGETAGFLNWQTFATAVCGSLLLLLAYRAIRMIAGYGATAPAAAYGLKSGYAGTAAVAAPAVANLTDAVKNAITPDIVHKLSASVGENPVSTRKALDAMIPTIMAGVAEQASTPSGLTKVFEMARDSVSGNGNIINNLASHVTGSGMESIERTGQGFLSSIFGDKLSAVINWIAKFAGIKGASASPLMSVASNMVMNVLGKQIVNNGLSLSSLGNLLSGQKSWLSRLLPSGVSEVPGMHALSDYADQAGSAVRGAAQYGENAVRGTAREVSRVGAAAASEAKPWLSALAPLLLIGLLAGTLPFLLQSCATKVTPPVVRAPDVKIPEVKIPNVTVPIVHVSNYRPDLSKLVSVKLPSGINLEIPEGSFVRSIHSYLADATEVKPQTFVFEGLTFDRTGIKSAAETESDIRVLTAILKSYPNTTVRIDGYTDKSADAAADRQISKERADAVKEMIVKVGIPSERITTEGHGSENPVAANDTEENRAKNRRIELTITRK